MDQKYLDQLKKSKSTLELPRNNMISKAKEEQIMDFIMKKYELKNHDEALTIIAIFAQQGASSPSCDGNLSFTFKSKEYKLADIRKCFAENGAKQGVRKFARTYGTG